jgi:hypothetical protein
MNDFEQYYQKQMEDFPFDDFEALGQTLLDNDIKTKQLVPHAASAGLFTVMFISLSWFGNSHEHNHLFLEFLSSVITAIFSVPLFHSLFSDELKEKWAHRMMRVIPRFRKPLVRYEYLQKELLMMVAQREFQLAFLTQIEIQVEQIKKIKNKTFNRLAGDLSERAMTIKEQFIAEQWFEATHTMHLILQTFKEIDNTLTSLEKQRNFEREHYRFKNRLNVQLGQRDNVINLEVEREKEKEHEVHVIQDIKKRL